MPLIKIDGSYGEGGGQILRTSLSLACALGRAIEIHNIRKGRPKPGLQPQHLASVKAASAVSNAQVEGAEMWSTALRFSPAGLRAGEYSFDVAEKRGSAGSTSLVLQTLILPLLLADGVSRITVKGGTHVPWSPSFHYLKTVFVPLVNLLGGKVELGIEQWGWYPAGGGSVTATVEPAEALRPISITDRGRLIRVSGISAAANLPADIAERQRRQAINVLGSLGIEPEIAVLSAPSPGRGTFLFLAAECETTTAGFDGLGARGKRAEAVADEACRDLLAYLDGSGALDPHLADQIVPYLALAGGKSVFTTTRITRHLLTNIWVVQQFLDVAIAVEGSEGREGRVTIAAGGGAGRQGGRTETRRPA